MPARLPMAHSRPRPVGVLFPRRSQLHERVERHGFGKEEVGNVSPGGNASGSSPERGRAGPGGTGVDHGVVFEFLQGMCSECTSAVLFVFVLGV